MKKLIMASITAVVVIAVLAGTLIPVLDDATATTDTFTNEGYYNVMYSPTTDVTLSWEYTTPTIVTVNDVDYDLSDINVDVTLVCGDDWILRYRPGTNATMMLWPSSGNGIPASVSDQTNLTLSASDGSCTVTSTASSNNTATVSYTTLYCIDNNGDYVMRKAGTTCYVNGDSTIYAIGVTNLTGGVASVIKFTGNVDDGITGDVYRASGATLSDINFAYSEVNDHLDLYSVDKITAIGTYNGSDTNITYSYFIVPAEVTAERSVHFTDGENAILNTIPVMIIIALLLGVVALVLRSRMD